MLFAGNATGAERDRWSQEGVTLGTFERWAKRDSADMDPETKTRREQLTLIAARAKERIRLTRALCEASDKVLRETDERIASCSELLLEIKHADFVGFGTRS